MRNIALPYREEEREAFLLADKKLKSVGLKGENFSVYKRSVDARKKENIRAGSVLRYCVQMALHERIVPYNFPWATFTVNIVGSFLIGLFYAWSARFNLPTEIRLLLTTGLCGGFTTFSTFSNDGLTLLKQGYGGLFLLYVLLSIVLGILAALGGNLCGR